MKLLLRAALVLAVPVIILLSCESPKEKQESLVKTHCGSCHALPDPSQLDKQTWETQVLPRMAFRMGLDFSQLSSLSEEDRDIVLKVIPGTPQVSLEEWESIRNYYLTLAPDSLKQPEIAEEKSLHQFNVTTFQFEDDPLPAVSMIKADTFHNTIYAATQTLKLYKLDFDLKQKSVVPLESPLSDMILSQNETALLSMGIINPNDQSKGSIVLIEDEKMIPIIDSLKRPASMEMVDLNNDGLKDYVVCAFGNFTGALLAYENLGQNKFRVHTMSYMPGVRNVVITDENHDGLPDVVALFTQGDEQIVQFTSRGNFEFKQTSVLRFPAVYGSSYFQLADFNGDGNRDILYTNGDNGDYGVTLRPYHGVRIFLNDGKSSFKENWFYPMHGASKAIAYDFDGDGDSDIAAIAFYPDLIKTPQRGFIYFENTGNGFTPYVTPLASAGRWAVMESVDLDHDDDLDIILGAVKFKSFNKPGAADQSSQKAVSLLLLRNNLH